MNRRGVSLMEVLMSIGVVTIGLMGVASLLPVAYKQAESGSRNDRMAIVGRRAFREMQTRGFLRTHFQMNADDFSTPYLSRLYDTGTDYWPTAVLDALDYRQAFMIDARGVAGLWNDLTVDVANDGQFAFPSVPPKGSPEAGVVFSPVEFRMPRVSVTPAAGTIIPMGAAQAEKIFVVEDDLEFADAESNAALPQQLTIPELKPNVTTTFKRSAVGNMSWVATVVPEQSASDVYRVSVAVLYQRNPPFQADITRRIINIYGGIGGGEIEIEPGPAPLELRPGQWLMIAIVRMGTAPIYRWYRTVSASDIVQFREAVSLQGPNIPAFGYDRHFDPEDPSTPSANSNGYEYFAVIMPDVISVYEKTMRLQGDSLWAY